MDARTPPVLYTVDLCGCEALAAMRPAAISALFAATLERAGATILQTVTHVFPGAGLTCVLVLSESHAALHTWPESGTVHVDIFSCSGRLKSLEAIDDLGRSFGAHRLAVQEVRRADGRRSLAVARP